MFPLFHGLIFLQRKSIVADFIFAEKRLVYTGDIVCIAYG